MTPLSWVKRLATVLAVFILVALLAGCGKKGPPVPPRRYRPPAVSDLDYRLDGRTLTLTWSLPADAGDKPAAADGCIVYQARQPQSDTACPGCPQPFARVADLPVEAKTPARQQPRFMQYAGELDRGFVYTFKVVCYTHDGGPGDGSNLVNVEF